MNLKSQSATGIFLIFILIFSYRVLAQVRLTETGAAQTNFVALQAPSLISSNYILYFPASDGVANQCLATNGAGALQWRTTAGTGYSLDAVDGSPTNAVYVDAAGNVGIGTTSPTQTIQLYRNQNSASFVQFENASAGTSASSVIYALANGAGFAMQMMGTNSNGGGIYQPGRAVLAADAGVTTLAISNDGAKPILFATSSTERMRVDSGGNVGIGATTPGTKLDVNGTVRFGTNGGIISNLGTCTFNQAVTTSDATATCTGIPASSSVAVHCSPTAALSAAVGIIFRATGTLNQIALRGTVAAAAVNWICMWMQP